MSEFDISASTVIWVVNRSQLFKVSFGVVTISEDGNLVTLNGQKQFGWSSNVSNVASHSLLQRNGPGMVGYLLGSQKEFYVS